jgi:inward rectifier potassium channel
MASTVQERTPEPTRAEDRDLGFGGRVAQETTVRLLNRDGTFNVTRKGLSFVRSLNVYHAFLTMSWGAFFATTALGYVAANLLFAALYLLCGPGALHGAHGVAASERFLDAFFFSVQTLATIGYGGVSPSGLLANLLVTVEAFVGLMAVALATGILFSRFSRPTAQIAFSQTAVVGPYRGITGFMFRIANERRSQLIEVNATVSLSRQELVDGVRTRKFHELALERRRVVFFPLHWVIVHPIDEKSPLFGTTAEDFAAADSEILILLSAIDETFSQTVQARSSYKPAEVVWNARFADMFERSADGRLAIDLRKIHALDRTPSPP